MTEITLIIDKKTPSINHLYGQRGYRRFLTKEGKELKEYIISYCEGYKIAAKQLANKPLKIFVEIHENWLTKKGILARKDIANREKFLVDSVFEGLGLDDRFIMDHRMLKIQSGAELSVINLYT